MFKKLSEACSNLGRHRLFSTTIPQQQRPLLGSITNVSSTPSRRSPSQQAVPIGATLTTGLKLQQEPFTNRQTSRSLSTTSESDQFESFIKHKDTEALLKQLKENWLPFSDQHRAIDILLSNTPNKLLHAFNQLKLRPRIAEKTLKSLVNQVPDMVANNLSNICIEEGKQLTLLKELATRVPKTVLSKLPELKLPKQYNFEIIALIAEHYPNHLFRLIPFNLVEEFSDREKCMIAVRALRDIPSGLKKDGEYREINSAQLHAMINIANGLRSHQMSSKFSKGYKQGEVEKLDRLIPKMIDEIFRIQNQWHMNHTGLIFSELNKIYGTTEFFHSLDRIETVFETMKPANRCFGFAIILLTLNRNIYLSEQNFKDLLQAFNLKKVSLDRTHEIIGLLHDFHLFNVSSEYTKDSLLHFPVLLEKISARKKASKLCFLSSIYRVLLRQTKFRPGRTILAVSPEHEKQSALLAQLAANAFQFQFTLNKTNSDHPLFSGEEKAAGFISYLSRMRSGPVKDAWLNLIKSEFIDHDFSARRENRLQNLHLDILHTHCPDFIQTLNEMDAQGRNKFFTRSPDNERVCVRHVNDFTGLALFGTLVQKSCQTIYDNAGVNEGIAGTLQDLTRMVFAVYNEESGHWYGRVAVDVVFDANAYKEAGVIKPLMLVQPLYSNTDFSEEHLALLRNQLKEVSETFDLPFASKGQEVFVVPKAAEAITIYCDQRKGLVKMNTGDYFTVKTDNPFQ